MSIEYSSFGSEIKLPESGTGSRIGEQAKALDEQVKKSAQPTVAQISNSELQAATETLTKVAQNLNQDIRFAIDNEAIDGPIIRVVDRETGDVVRQIPSEDFVRLALRMQELSTDEAIDSATGLLIDSQA
ncbi:flagellar protein FlaG [Aliidiomarina sp. Khilg15.8]